MGRIGRRIRKRGRWLAMSISMRKRGCRHDDIAAMDGILLIALLLCLFKSRRENLGFPSGPFSLYVYPRDMYMYIWTNEYACNWSTAGSFSRSFRLYTCIVVAGIWMDEKMSKYKGERQTARKQEKVKLSTCIYCYLYIACFAQDESLVTLSKSFSFFSFTVLPLSTMTRQI